MSLSILGATAARPIVASRNLIIASSSYLPSSTATCQSRRTVVHHARPPRRPRQATHLEALEVKATAGTSRPNPTSQPKPSINSVSFNHQGVELELHHVPPPTAPDYTSGRVPDVLRWLGGANDVRADAQGVGAPFVRSGGAASAEQVQGLLSNEVVEQMRQLRAQEPLKWSRSALMRRFNIDPSLSSTISRLVPTPQERGDALDRSAAARKEGWGWKKRLAREVREARKGLW